MNGKREVEVAINSLREEGFSEECTEALAGIWRWKESGKMQREVMSLCGVDETTRNGMAVAALRIVEEMIG